MTGLRGGSEAFGDRNSGQDNRVMLTGMEELKLAGFQIRELPGLTDVRTQRPLNLIHHIRTPGQF